eukprot:5666141-Prymnesium_polylepis.1
MPAHHAALCRGQGHCRSLLIEKSCASHSFASVLRLLGQQLAKRALDGTARGIGARGLEPE